jgi:hypothetical protein
MCSRRTCLRKLKSSENFGSCNDILKSRPSAMQFLVSMLAGILGDCLIGPHKLPALVSGRDDLNFVRAHLSGLLEDVSFNTSSHMRCQHNHPPPCYSHEVHPRFSDNYPGRFTVCGREGQVSGLHVHLSSIRSIFSAGAFENHSLCH